MDARAEKPVLCAETNKKRHFQRIQSPSRYTRIYRPRFEAKNFRSRFRFFRSMEERFFHRPHFALRYQRHHTGHWSNLQLSRRAKAPSSSSSSGLRRRMDDRAKDIPRPSSGDTASLSFTVSQKTKKRNVTCAGVRTRAIQKKQEQIEEVYRQDCDTFGMVVKMLVAKDPSLEKPIQLSLRENLRDIGTRCIRAMEQFIQEYDSREPNAPSSSKCFLSTED